MPDLLWVNILVNNNQWNWTSAQWHAKLLQIDLFSFKWVTCVFSCFYHQLAILSLYSPCSRLATCSPCTLQLKLDGWMEVYTHSDTLTAGFGHGDSALQPRCALYSSPLPHFFLSALPLGHNPQYIHRIWAVHEVSKFDTDLGGNWWEQRAQQTSRLPIGNIVTLMVDVISICRS